MSTPKTPKKAQTFNEKDNEARIQALRESILTLSAQVQAKSVIINRLLEHIHLPDGKMMLELKHQDKVPPSKVDELLK